MPLTDIRAMLDSEAPLVLDGGLGSELDARGYDVSSALWSAELVSSHPLAIVASFMIGWYRILLPIAPIIKSMNQNTN